MHAGFEMRENAPHERRSTKRFLDAIRNPQFHGPAPINLIGAASDEDHWRRRKRWNLPQAQKSLETPAVRPARVKSVQIESMILFKLQCPFPVRYHLHVAAPLVSRPTSASAVGMWFSMRSTWGLLGGWSAFPTFCVISFIRLSFQKVMPLKGFDTNTSRANDSFTIYFRKLACRFVRSGCAPKRIHFLEDFRGGGTRNWRWRKPMWGQWCRLIDEEARNQ